MRDQIRSQVCMGARGLDAYGAWRCTGFQKVRASTPRSRRAPQISRTPGRASAGSTTPLNQHALSAQLAIGKKLHAPYSRETVTITRFDAPLGAHKLIESLHLCATDCSLQVGHPIVEPNGIVLVVDAAAGRRRQVTAPAQQLGSSRRPCRHRRRSQSCCR